MVNMRATVSHASTYLQVEALLLATCSSQLTHGTLGDCDPRGEALVLRGLRGLLMSARGESCAGGCGCSPSAWLRFSSGITGGSIESLGAIESLAMNVPASVTCMCMYAHSESRSLFTVSPRNCFWARRRDHDKRQQAGSRDVRSRGAPPDPCRGARVRLRSQRPARPSSAGHRWLALEVALCAKAVSSK